MEEDNRNIRVKENDLITLPLLKLIMKNLKVNINEASFMVRYNVITPLAIAKITNRSISSVHNLMRPRQVPGGYVTTLKKVFPFAYGAVYVLFDKNCLDYILSTSKHPMHGKTTEPVESSEGGEPTDN